MPRYRTISPMLAALAAGLVMFAVMLAVDNFERKQDMKDQRLDVMAQVSALRAKLEAAISASVSVTRGIAVIYAARPDLSSEEFAKLAEQARTFSPNILNIALIRDTVIRDVYPRKGNEQLIGLDFRKLPAQWPAYEKMMTTRQTVAAGSMTLVQGGEAIVVRTPVFHTSATTGLEYFVGAVSVPILFDSLLSDAGLPAVEQGMIVAIRGRDGKGASGGVLYGSPGVFDADPVLQKIVVPGGSWEIAALPRSGWGGSSPTLDLIRVMGGVLCVLAAALAYLLARYLRRQAENERRLQISEMRLKQRSAELVHQNAVLEMIAHHAKLPAILEMLVELIELHHPEMLCSIMLLDQDGKHLRHGAAPRLPDFYNQAVDGIAIGEGVGACGTAAYRGERVIIEDVQGNTDGGSLRTLLRRANLQSCWSQPIKDHDGRVLGTFAIYHHYPNTPQHAEIMLIENYAALAALAIERTRNAEALRLHDAALNVVANAVVITDREARIVWANQAFTRLTGYEFEEAVGHHCGGAGQIGPTRSGVLRGAVANHQLRPDMAWRIGQPAQGRQFVP